uniref:Uncharacterized protein n=1 Tax=Rhizophora mucronata TaxID=61149 RepID=A0A2P2PU53_RHIMU
MFVLLLLKSLSKANSLSCNFHYLYKCCYFMFSNLDYYLNFLVTG